MDFADKPAAPILSYVEEVELNSHLSNSLVVL
jgi:hypothetical protein